MHIGIPKEIKDHEYRVALTPEGAALLVATGHRVTLQHDAGRAVGFDDAAYRTAGAEITDDVATVFACEMIVKVKEPQAVEVARLRAGQMLFCYLHLAPAPDLARALMQHGVSAIAYETVADSHGALPLLQPMSEIAGRLAPQMGAQALHMAHGGNGVLVTGMPGVVPARICIIGAGVVGMNAARVAVGLGAHVTMLDRARDKLVLAETLFGARVETRFSTPAAIAHCLAQSDIVIGAAQIPGRHAPRLITRSMIEGMSAGSALVDVAIDQGGISETSRPTTHSQPMYIEAGVVHYCVANMPGAVARTATLALTHATLPYILRLADSGLAAVEADAGLRLGLQVHAGEITHEGLRQEISGC